MKLMKLMRNAAYFSIKFCVFFSKQGVQTLFWFAVLFLFIEVFLLFRFLKRTDLIYFTDIYCPLNNLKPFEIRCWFFSIFYFHDVISVRHPDSRAFSVLKNQETWKWIFIFSDFWDLWRLSAYLRLENEEAFALL